MKKILIAFVFMIAPLFAEAQLKTPQASPKLAFPTETVYGLGAGARLVDRGHDHVAELGGEQADAGAERGERDRETGLVELGWASHRSGCRAGRPRYRTRPR